MFAREVVPLGTANRDELPWLVFLQGGPGGASPRPAAGGWLTAALEKYRLLLLDQRGTGSSTRVTTETLLAAFGDDAVGMAEYLSHFRADSIVADAEAMRVVLAGKQVCCQSLKPEKAATCPWAATVV